MSIWLSRIFATLREIWGAATITGFAVFPCTRRGSMLFAFILFWGPIWILYIPASRRSVLGAAAIWYTDPGEGDLWRRWHMRCCKSVRTGAMSAITGTSAGATHITPTYIGPLSF